jgi:hypothetical protein
MKTTFSPMALLLGFFAVTSSAFADPSPGGNVDVYTQTDPDGVPLSVTHAQSKAPTREQVDAYNKQQQQADQDKNWLVNGYEQQREAHAASDASQGQQSDFNSQSTVNKDLAPLGGISSDANGKSTAASQSDNRDHPNQTGDGSRNAAFTGSSLKPFSYAPLVNPLSQSVNLGLNSYFPNLSASAPAPSKRNDTRDSDLDTPGMIAAKKDPLLDITAGSDPNLEALPGESIQDAREHQTDYGKLQLPMDSDQLHATQAAARSAPMKPAGPAGPSNAQTSKTIPVAKPIPINQDDAPQPVNSAPVISPVRPAIANPFDILNR